MLKEQKIRSKKHRMFIASLPCCVCGIQGMTQAAHIRTGNGAGMGLKSGDDNCVPLCIRCHREQHEHSEVKYWGRRLEKAKDLAKTLYAITGNTDEALLLLVRFSRNS